MLRPLTLTLSLLAAPALSEVPRVVTDIPPVHGLVAMVLGPLGTPDLLVDGGASPHGYALKPSQARALSQAGIVVWTGPALMPQLDRQIETLAPDAVVLSLSEAEGSRLLPFREGGLFAHDHAGHGDAHEGEDHDEHGHDDHDDHDHDEHAHEDHDDHAHEDHAHEEHEDHDGHDHHDAAYDPHLWLDPDNALTWLEAIRAALSQADPENAETYAANAQEAAEAIRAARDEAARRLDPVRDRPIAAFHDAFQYYENAFGLQMIGSVTDGDDAEPGAARLDSLRTLFRETPPACVLAEPGTDTRLLRAVAEDAMAGDSLPLAEIDPLGSRLEAGAALYPALLQDLAQRIADCAGSQG